METIDLENTNLHKICRSCLLKNGIISIFEEKSLHSMLTTVCHTKAFEFDGFPPSLCGDCIDRLNKAFSFHEQCAKARLIIQNYINQTPIKKESFFEDNAKVQSDEEKNLCLNDLKLSNKNCSDIISNENNLETKEVKKTKLKTSKTKVNLKNKQQSKNLAANNTADRKENKLSQSTKIVHIETISEKGDKIYKCILCDVLYQTQKDLIKHYRTHDRKRPFICPQCGKSFRWPHLLNDHVLRHSGLKLYRCEICAREYKFKDSLKIHFRSHTGYKPYSCTDCDKAFPHLTQLRSHQRMHTKEKPYMCPHCGMCMSMLSSLRAHVKRIHTNDRPHKCSECNKGFVDNYELKMHSFTHTGGAVKNHFCTVCEKSFTRATYLKVHMRIHTDEKPFVCKFCGKGFRQKHVMNTHFNTHVNEVELC